MSRVLNGNLIALKWQNISVISNIKYSVKYGKTWSSSLLYIQQFSLLYITFKKVISFKVTSFRKNSILDVSKGSGYFIAQ